MNDTTTITMTYDEWIETFQPEMYPETGEPRGYETFGADLEHVLFQLLSSHKNHVWTEIETDDGFVIVEGYHWVNRMRYFITTVPYIEGDQYDVSE